MRMSLGLLLAVAFYLGWFNPAIQAQTQKIEPVARPQYEAALNAEFSKSQSHFVCAGIGFVAPPGPTIEGPSYYFSESTRKLISACGMACWVGEDRRRKNETCESQCPPPEWRASGCDGKYREFELAKLPDINEPQARALASSSAGCHPTRRVCEIHERSGRDPWTYEISFTRFQDKSDEDWTRRFGLKRVVVGRKGQIIETQWWHKMGGQ